MALGAFSTTMRAYALRVITLTTMRAYALGALLQMMRVYALRVITLTR